MTIRQALTAAVLTAASAAAGFIGLIALAQG